MEGSQPSLRRACARRLAISMLVTATLWASVPFDARDGSGWHEVDPSLAIANGSLTRHAGRIYVRAHAEADAVFDPEQRETLIGSSPFSAGVANGSEW